MLNAEMNERLGKILVEQGIITGETLNECMAQVDGDKNVTLEKILLGKNIAEQQMLDAKSKVLGCQCCFVKDTTPDPEALKLITKKQALKYCCLILGHDETYPNGLNVVVEDPDNFDTVSDLQLITGLEIIPILGMHDAILQKIEECYPEPDATPVASSAGKDSQKAPDAANNASKDPQKTPEPDAADNASKDPQKTSEPDAADNASKPAGAVKGIERYDVNEEWAHSGIIKAGNFYYLSYCVGNIGGTIEEQVNGAFDHMEKRLGMVGLTLENVIQMDCLFRDVWNIPVMEKVIKERFHGKYPARKSIQTNFAHVGGENGLLFQVDGIAYSEE